MPLLKKSVKETTFSKSQKTNSRDETQISFSTSGHRSRFQTQPPPPDIEGGGQKVLQCQSLGTLRAASGVGGGGGGSRMPITEVGEATIGLVGLLNGR